MSSHPRTTMSRILGAAWTVISATTLAVALSRQPLGEWGVLNLVTGGALLILLLAGLFYLVTARSYSTGSADGYRNPQRLITLSWVAIVLIAIAATMSFLADGTVGISAGDATGDVLMLGLWLDLIVMMLVNIRAARLQLAGRW